MVRSKTKKNHFLFIVKGWGGEKKGEKLRTPTPGGRARWLDTNQSLRKKELSKDEGVVCFYTAGSG